MMASCQKILQLTPDLIEANALLGMALYKLDRAADALNLLAIAY